MKLWQWMRLPREQISREKRKMIVYMPKESKIEVEEDRRKGVLPELEEEKIKRKGAINSGPTG